MGAAWASVFRAVIAQQNHAHDLGVGGAVPQASDLGDVHGVSAANALSTQRSALLLGDEHHLSGASVPDRRVHPLLGRPDR